MEDHREFYYDNDEYFNPKLNLNDSVLKEKVLNLIDVFRIPKSKIDSLQKRIINAIDSVLSNKDSSKNSEFLPLFNTLVTKYPNNQESGVFLGLDIGGTNLRIVLLNLKDSDESDRKIIIDNYDVPVEFRQSTSEKFFDYLAGCLKNFYDKNQNILKDSPSRIPLGFSFSFCFEQLTINSGRCLQFSIATNLIDGIGKCPVQLFQKSIDSLQLPVEIVALANDSTTTLICGKYFDPKTEISLILGSGGNVAYVENVAADFRIENPREKFGLPLAPEKMIINSEVFLFGDNHQIDDLKTCYDFELDAMSLLPGNYTLEKMIGGAFLGELFRMAILDLVRNRLILNGKFTAFLVRPQSIPTARMSSIDAEIIANSNATALKRSFTEIDSMLIECLDYQKQEIDDDDRNIIAYLCQIISIRCALICSSILAAFIDRFDASKYPSIKICCDGSLYKKHPKMDRLINGFLKAMVPQQQQQQCQIFPVDNGSSVGAALLAACYRN